MSLEQAQVWAAEGDVESMVKRLQRTEAWVAEISGTIVGWTAVYDSHHVHRTNRGPCENSSRQTLASRRD